MKLALPTKNNEIDSHFGHCEYFTVMTVNDNKEIIEEKTVPSPAGCGCKSNIAQTLKEIGVSVMLAGNMGDGAVRVLANHGIQVVRGCCGDVKAVALNYLKGLVKDSNIGCHEHEHECHK
jgi:predicted Fe-Mo cluster-binding NifX family protein